MVLEEAREQYSNLLTQFKNSNASALQRKALFLQKNLEQLTKVQQEVRAPSLFISLSSSRLAVSVCVPSFPLLFVSLCCRFLRPSPPLPPPLSLSLSPLSCISQLISQLKL